jgi:hypothetical protein
MSLFIEVLTIDSAPQQPAMCRSIRPWRTRFPISPSTVKDFKRTRGPLEQVFEYLIDLVSTRDTVENHALSLRKKSHEYPISYKTPRRLIILDHLGILLAAFGQFRYCVDHDLTGGCVNDNLGEGHDDSR